MLIPRKPELIVTEDSHPAIEQGLLLTITCLIANVACQPYGSIGAIRSL